MPSNFLTLPYYHLERLWVFGWYVETYYGLIVAGLLLGSCVGFPMARRLKLDLKTLAELYLTGLASGLLLSHWVSVVFYFPETILENPLVLLDVFNGLSSVGGFFGAFLGVYLLTRGTKIPLLPYLDALCFGLSFGEIFGRLGCALTHDHPGHLTDFALAVQFPDGARFDLGLYELVLLLPLVAWQAVYLYRRPRPRPGRVVGWTMIYYGCIRFCLDFLRAFPGEGPGGAGDPRYLGLTAAQVFCVGFVVGGIIMLSRLRGPAPEPAEGGPAVTTGEPAAGDAERASERAAGEGGG